MKGGLFFTRIFCKFVLKEGIHMEKRQLSPMKDIVFHMLFGEPKNENITKQLIEDVIGEKVEEIELDQNPYLWGMQADDKLGILDIKAKINDSIPVDIEMQTTNK